MTRKAYQLTYEGTPAIVAATTPGKARYVVYLSLRDIGYRATFSDIHCVRATQFDDWAKDDCGKTCWDPSVLPATPLERLT